MLIISLTADVPLELFSARSSDSYQKAMSMRISILVLVSTLAMFLPMQTEAVPALPEKSISVDNTWLLSYQGKPTGAVRWDARFPALLKSGLPHYDVKWWDNKPLPDAAFDLLSGPTDMVTIESNRYVTLSAAANGVAFYKGLLWVDTGASSPEMIFAYLFQDQFNLDHASIALFTGSNRLAEKLPPQLLATLIRWQSHHGITKITSLTMDNAEGKITHLPLAILGSN